MVFLEKAIDVSDKISPASTEDRETISENLLANNTLVALTVIANQTVTINFKLCNVPYDRDRRDTKSTWYFFSRSNPKGIAFSPMET